MDAIGEAGAARFIFELPVHPWLSVIVTEKLPEPKLLAVAPVPPVGDHKYVYGPVPPDATTVAEPLVEPQVGCVGLIAPETKVGCVTVAEVVAVQPFASVIVAVYVPAARLAMDADVPTFGVHE